MKKGKLGAILLALVLIIGLVCCVVCLEKIPAGYVGVVYNMNGGDPVKTKFPMIAHDGKFIINQEVYGK